MPEQPDALVEWKYEFRIDGSGLTTRQQADALMDVAIEWAEGHRLGVGGVYQPVPLASVELADAWSFAFGLCATQDQQFISRQLAGELWDVLRNWCQSNALNCLGGFRPFTPDELGDTET